MVWQSGLNAADCSAIGCSGPPALHRAPTPRARRFGCGFHAYWHLEQLANFLGVQRQVIDEGYAGLVAGSFVTAVVAATGRVQLCTKGWRASHAEVLAIFGGTELDALLADRYRIRLLPIPSRRDRQRTEGFLHELGMTQREALRVDQGN